MRGELLRQLGTTVERAKRQGVVAEHRVRFVQETGRLPDRNELARMLAPEFTNPNIVIEASDRQANLLTARGGEREDECDPLAFAPSREPAPDRRLIDRETERMALKTLNKKDRQAFQLLLRGVHPQEIARRTGVAEPTIRIRLNGLLWEVRSRADLARYVGTEAHQKPAKDRWNRYPYALGRAAELLSEGNSTAQLLAGRRRKAG